MRHVGVAMAAACAAGLCVGGATGQFSTTGNSGQAAMPGQVVGTPVTLNPVGTSIPKATTPAGSPIGNPLMRPYDPSKPYDVFKGTGIDPNSVVAPISGFPGFPTKDPTLLDRVY